VKFRVEKPSSTRGRLSFSDDRLRQDSRAILKAKSAGRYVQPAMLASSLTNRSRRRPANPGLTWRKLRRLHLR
jgi:hypothetical protein